MDFTFKTYKRLITGLIFQGYEFQTFSEFAGKPVKQAVIIRHDVDRKPGNALKMAQLEKQVGINGTYYFRALPGSFDKKVIEQIAGMGHEIGYHYENLSTVARRKEYRKRETAADNRDPKDRNRKFLYKSALNDFKKNLEMFRKLVPIKTICMHGSPLSRFDNRDLWKVYDYRDFGIECEPYFDLDFSEVFYLTDTGRRWDGDHVNVRDRVNQTDKKRPVYRTTWDIIDAVTAGTFPLRVMITIHPQRWSDNSFDWAWELISQRVKNAGKRMLIRAKGSK